jgi:hypothetical protein
MPSRLCDGEIERDKQQRSSKIQGDAKGGQ